MPRARRVWDGAAADIDLVVPDWWYETLDHVKSELLVSEYSSSSGPIAQLRQDPVHRRALAAARAVPPPTVSLPTANTVMRMHANVTISSAASTRELIHVSSRDPVDLDDFANGKGVVQMRCMPIPRPQHWDKIGLQTRLLCHCCDSVVEHADRGRITMCDCMERAYCSAHCRLHDAPAHVVQCAANVGHAANAVAVWRRRRSWPFAVVRVDAADGRALVLPQDTRALLGSSCLFERSDLNDGLPSETVEVVDRLPALAQARAAALAAPPSPTAASPNDATGIGARPGQCRRRSPRRGGGARDSPRAATRGASSLAPHTRASGVRNGHRNARVDICDASRCTKPLSRYHEYDKRDANRCRRRRCMSRPRAATPISCDCSSAKELRLQRRTPTARPRSISRARAATTTS